MTVAQIRCLLAMLTLTGVKEQVASKDVADTLNISRPSVHRLLEALVLNGYVAKEAYGTAMLTEMGREEARRMAQHKAALSRALMEHFTIPDDESEHAALALMCTLREETLVMIENNGKCER